MSCKRNHIPSKCLDTTSSSCVIWDGPDIECLGLCKGDTVTDVVYKSAKLLCSLLEKLDISYLDFKCYLEDPNKPKDIEGLLQWIIDKLCELKEREDGLNIDCNYVRENIFSCQINFDFCDSNGNLNTVVLPLYSQTGSSFVSLVANAICTINSEIIDIKGDIANINTQINYILENCCSDGGGGGFSISIIPNPCVYPNGNAPQVINDSNGITEYLYNISNVACCIRNLLGYDNTQDVCNVDNCGPFNYANYDVYLNPCNPDEQYTTVYFPKSFTVSLCNYNSLVNAVANIYNFLFSGPPQSGLMHSLYTITTYIKACFESLGNQISDCNCECNKIRDPFVFYSPLTAVSNSFSQKHYNLRVVRDSGPTYGFTCDIVKITNLSRTVDDKGTTINAVYNHNDTTNQLFVTIPSLDVNPFQSGNTYYSDYIYHNLNINVVYTNLTGGNTVCRNEETEICVRRLSVNIEDKYYTCGDVIEFGAYTNDIIL